MSRPAHRPPLDEWHPDVDTAVIWTGYARRQRRDDVAHWLRVGAAVVGLTFAGFAAVLALHRLLA